MFSGGDELQALQSQAAEHETMWQWLYQRTEHRFTEGNQRFREWGEKVSTYIHGQQEQYREQTENIKGAFGDFREKFLALYWDVVRNRQGLLQHEERQSNLLRDVQGVQQSGAQLQQTLGGM